jgi:Arc/MetJ family transcription regulator
MATNLAIDQELLREALEVSGLRTKKDTVTLIELKSSIRVSIV